MEDQLPPEGHQITNKAFASAVEVDSRSREPDERRPGDAGKRRQGREMALQMLYQWETADTHPSEVLRSFDLSLYKSETAAGSGREGERGGKEESADFSGDQQPSLPVEPRSEARTARQSPKEEGSAAEGDVAEGDVEQVDRRRAAAARDNRERQISAELGPKSRSKAYRFARSLVVGVVEHQQTLDAAISSAADNWRIERMPSVDLNILRTALFEARFLRELPKAVIIDEAIELAKRFGGENSSAFVNGLLDGLLVER